MCALAAVRACFLVVLPAVLGFVRCPAEFPLQCCLVCCAASGLSSACCGFVCRLLAPSFRCSAIDGCCVVFVFVLGC